VGYLTTFYSKNMIVVMFVALATANVLKYGSSVRVRDGFTADDEKEDKEDKTTLKDGSKDGSKDDTKNAAKDTASKTDTKKADKEKKSTSPTDTAKAQVDATLKSLDEKPMDPKQKEAIKELLDLQLKIMTGVSDIAPLLKQAQAAMTNIKSNGTIDTLLQ